MTTTTMGGTVRILLLLGLLMPVPASAGALLDEQNSPEWMVSEWINDDPGTIGSQRGRVVLIQLFQLWCPACQEFSIPLFKQWSERYAGSDDVLVVSIHSVFEGHPHQTPDRLREFLKIWGVTHPVGIDAYSERDPETPVTMKRFKAEGTPFVAIVDRQGKLRFTHFGKFDPEVVEAFVTRLLNEPPDPEESSSSSGKSKGQRGRISR